MKVMPGCICTDRLTFCTRFSDRVSKSGLYGLAHDEIDPEDSTPKHDRKRLSTNGAFGVKKRNTKSNPEEDKEVVEEEKEEVVSIIIIN